MSWHLIKRQTIVQAIFQAILIGILVFNLFLIRLNLRNQAFDHDEFQHVHLAWDTRQGKIIYRDFFDHHGPVFPVINALFMNTLGWDASIATLHKLRFLSFIWLIGILLVIFILGRKVTQSNPAGLFAATLLSSLVFFQDKATEIRPDVLQNLFWLLGIYFLLAQDFASDFWKTLIAGLFFGLAIHCNSKAGIGPFLVFIYILWVVRPFSRAVQILAKITLGIACIYFMFITYFASQGALKEFLFYNYPFNFLSLEGHSQNFPTFFSFFLKKQTPFLILFVLGLFCLRKSSPTATSFIKTLTFCTSLSAGIGFYKQFYLIFLPLMAVVCSFPIGQRKQSVVMMAFLLSCLGFLTFYADQETPKKRHPWLKSQHLLTAKILRETSREEPVGYFWNNCGGFMFQADLQYFWQTAENMPQVLQRQQGFNVFGHAYIQKLEVQKVRFVIAQNEPLQEFAPETLSYLEHNFDREMCLWTRKPEP